MTFLETLQSKLAQLGMTEYIFASHSGKHGIPRAEMTEHFTEDQLKIMNNYDRSAMALVVRFKVVDGVGLCIERKLGGALTGKEYVSDEFGVNAEDFQGGDFPTYFQENLLAELDDYIAYRGDEETPGDPSRKPDYILDVDTFVLVTDLFTEDFLSGKELNGVKLQFNEIVSEDGGEE